MKEKSMVNAFFWRVATQPSKIVPKNGGKNFTRNSSRNALFHFLQIFLRHLYSMYKPFCSKLLEKQVVLLPFSVRLTIFKFKKDDITSALFNSDKTIGLKCVVYTERLHNMVNNFKRL